MMQFIKKSLLWLFFLIPIYSYADPILLGNESSKPLIIQKNSDGTWSKNLQISGLPADMNHVDLYTSSCTKTYCIAVGHYQKNGSDILPLILLSRDQGKSWAFIDKISGIPANINDVYMTSVHCEETTCMAVGGMLYGKERGARHQQPLLLISSNSGETWNASNAAPVNLFSKSEGQIDTITKSGQNWLASGYYFYVQHWPRTFRSQVKFFMLSRDNGATWKELNVEGGSATPPQQGLLLDLKCMNNLCIQTGENLTAFPFIARSEDNGMTWKTINDITGLPPGLDMTNVNTVSCNTSFCVSSGYDMTHLYLLFSHDKGVSWTRSEINNMPIEFEYGEINQIDCYNSTMCLAVGWWRKKGSDEFFPLLLSSYDKGMTWSYQNNPFIKSSAQFVSVKCENHVCRIIGNDDNSLLVLTSQDDGQTWVSQTDIIGLPSSSLSAFLNSDT